MGKKERSVTAADLSYPRAHGTTIEGIHRTRLLQRACCNAPISHKIRQTGGMQDPVVRLSPSSY
jgi:hypothetical protein